MQYKLPEELLMARHRTVRAERETSQFIDTSQERVLYSGEIGAFAGYVMRKADVSHKMAGRGKKR